MHFCFPKSFIVRWNQTATKLFLSKRSLRGSPPPPGAGAVGPAKAAGRGCHLAPRRGHAGRPPPRSAGPARGNGAGVGGGAEGVSVPRKQNSYRQTLPFKMPGFLWDSFADDYLTRFKLFPYKKGKEGERNGKIGSKASAEHLSCVSVHLETDLQNNMGKQTPETFTSLPCNSSKRFKPQPESNLPAVHPAAPKTSPKSTVRSLFSHFPINNC